MELKKIIENPKNKFKIEKVIFKPKIRNLIGVNYRYFLKYNHKFIFLGLKRDIDKVFGKLLKDVYGDLWFKDYPPTFFKNYLHKEHNKITRATEKTRIKKKPYYSKMRIQSKKNKIERLKQEIKKEQENLNKLIICKEE